ncbi:hypothetical protein ADA01nite_43390 [Aneurinibacillus danicus]|uniref:Uncharacterized protein n=1 Tax=Aneurinibacillus danicus TaxID=267746 RepID=A0A511VDH3_9BACL|nr:hypothetical protein ADA01nite_43390 [Aneurinibacillus danicus]
MNPRIIQHHDNILVRIPLDGLGQKHQKSLGITGVRRHTKKVSIRWIYGAKQRHMGMVAIRWDAALVTCF